MPFLIAAVVFVGALCLLNLVLALGILRRLREHTAQLGRLGGAALTPYDPAALVGRAMPAGAAATDVVAFFDVECDTCHERAPRFAELAEGRTALVAVVGDIGKAADLIQAVDGVANVVTGDDADRVAHALGLQVFPMFLRVGPDGTIVAADTEPDHILAAAGAT
ncbi:hypothetical protein [Rhizohabitans arisaemae]|uniref:hypothetical protein n=1 Tax=Rhizohabitans arisaemae TaxID=2720610 RepID=UPI0024B22540|nr:hypothetical protein [Rhizohabitans arisaemae]